ncbi:MAG: hypothetical protein QXG39_03765 [Candidatus Aenigmatarchaeota archaeon]
MTKANGNYFFLIVTAIICGFILIVSLPPIRRVFGSLYSYLDIIGGGKKSNFEKAVLCAYYRCAEGLAASITEKYCKEVYPDYNLPVSKNELATSEFAKKLLKEYMGDELRVCEALADVYPIEVVVGEGEKLEKAHVAEAIDCICQLGSGSTGGFERAQGRVWFGEEFKYDKKVKCATILECADSIISKESQKIYISTVRVTEHVMITTYNVLLYSFPIYKGSPYFYSPPGSGAPRAPYIPAVVFEETEEKEFTLTDNIILTLPDYIIFVELNKTGEKRKVFLGKFEFITFGGDVNICSGDAYLKVSISCDKEEKILCRNSSETFCNGEYTISSTASFIQLKIKKTH